jgi:hypothetical protein
MDTIQQRITDTIKQIEHVEERQELRWREHIELHRRELDRVVNRKQFIIGIVLLLIIQIAIPVIIYLL